MRLPRYIVPAVLLLTTIGRTQPQTDPAFEALVSRKMLDAALQTLEPAMLIEAVEKVAAAEKTLKKPYSVPLSGLMRVTFRAASQKRNAGVLDRLIVVAKGIPDDFSR